MDADYGADEGAGDAVGEPVDVGRDADADVGGGCDSDELYRSVFSEEHAEGEGDREGDGCVTGWPSPENSTIEDSEMELSAKGVYVDNLVVGDVIEDGTFVNIRMCSSGKCLVG